MTIWKPNDAEKRAIRAIAAAGEKRKPTTITIQIGVRYPLTGAGEISTNLLLVTPEGDIDATDLHDKYPWSDLACGIELTKDGKAIVDFYVYEKAFDNYGDLLTNVQAHVVTVGGKPMLTEVTGTGLRPVSGDTLWAFKLPPKHRTFGSSAAQFIARWQNGMNESITEFS